MHLLHFIIVQTTLPPLFIVYSQFIHFVSLWFDGYALFHFVLQ
jgi:hypothetical protein